MTNKYNYRKDLAIDRRNIEEAILNHAQVAYDWERLSIDAEIEKDDANEAYNIALIDIEEKIRNDPEVIELGLTEGAIKNKINSHPRIKRLRRKRNNAYRDYKMLKNAGEHFKTRKRMIESYLYHLHRTMEGDPKVPRKYEDIYRKETKERIKKNLEPVFKKRQAND